MIVKRVFYEEACCLCRASTYVIIYHLGGPGEKPGAARNLTLTQEAGGWVLRWLGPKEDSDIKYYTIEHKQDSQVNISPDCFSLVILLKMKKSISILISFL